MAFPLKILDSVSSSANGTDRCILSLGECFEGDWSFQAYTTILNKFFFNNFRNCWVPPRNTNVCSNTL